MATLPRSQRPLNRKPQDEAEIGDPIAPAPGHTLPGYTVDALLEGGKIDEARSELENLISAGVNSGPSIPMDDAFWERLLKRAQKRALESR